MFIDTLAEKLALKKVAGPFMKKRTRRKSKKPTHKPPSVNHPSKKKPANKGPESKTLGRLSDQVALQAGIDPKMLGLQDRLIINNAVVKHYDPSTPERSLAKATVIAGKKFLGMQQEIEHAEKIKKALSIAKAKKYGIRAAVGAGVLGAGILGARAARGDGQPMVVIAPPEEELNKKEIKMASINANDFLGNLALHMVQTKLASNQAEQPKGVQALIEKLGFAGKPITPKAKPKPISLTKGTVPTSNNVPSAVRPDKIDMSKAVPKSGTNPKVKVGPLLSGSTFGYQKKIDLSKNKTPNPLAKKSSLLKGAGPQPNFFNSLKETFSPLAQNAVQFSSRAVDAARAGGADLLRGTTKFYNETVVPTYRTRVSPFLQELNARGAQVADNVKNKLLGIPRGVGATPTNPVTPEVAGPFKTPWDSRQAQSIPTASAVNVVGPQIPNRGGILGGVQNIGKNMGGNVGQFVENKPGAALAIGLGGTALIGGALARLLKKKKDKDKEKKELGV